MVFIYFKRARFELNEFTKINFFLALYLANDIEEDIDEYKYEILPWALGTNKWRGKFLKFLRKRDLLLKLIDYRAFVSRKCCEEVMMMMPDHPGKD
jgi:speedy protein